MIFASAVAQLAWIGLFACVAGGISVWLIALENKKTALPLLFLVGLALVGWLIYWSVPLHGLEYEDAFEYIYSGWFRSIDPSVRNTVLNPVCVFGSLEGCEAVGTLPHPVGYTELLFLVIGVLGWSLECGQLVSGFLYLFTAVLVFGSGRMMGLSERAAFLAGVLFFTTPTWFCLGSSGFSEPISTFIMGACIFFVTALWRDHRRSDQGWKSNLIVAFSAGGLAFVGVLAPLVRREGVLLLLVPLTTLCLSLLGSHRSTRRVILSALGLTLIVLGILVPVMTTGGAALDISDVAPSGGRSFDLSRLPILGPLFALHLLDPTGYLLIAMLALAGTGSVRRNPTLVMCWVLVVSYFLLFSIFAHTYYFIHYGEIPYFHFDRYSLQLAVPMSLLGGAGLESILGLFLPTIRKNLHHAWIASILATLVFGGLGMGLGYAMRVTLSEEERRSRIVPVRWALENIPKDTMVITAEPLLFSLFGGSQQRVLAYQYADGLLALDGVESMIQDGGLFLFEPTDLASSDRTRYPAAWAAIQRYDLGDPLEMGGGNGSYRLFKLKAK